MSNIRVRRGVLASSLALALFAPHAFAQTSSTSSSDQQNTPQSSSSSSQPAAPQKATQLQAVTVTGSMIPRVEIEGPAPVVRQGLAIHAEDGSGASHSRSVAVIHELEGCCGEPVSSETGSYVACFRSVALEGAAQGSFVQ